MLLELTALVGFVGVIGLLLLKVWVLIQKDFWEKPKYDFWISGLTLIGFIFFFGLFQMAYLSSFGEETTITQDSGEIITIEDNDYLFLLHASTIITPLFWLGGIINVIEFVYLLARSGSNIAKNSRV